MAGGVPASAVALFLAAELLVVLAVLAGVRARRSGYDPTLLGVGVLSVATAAWAGAAGVGLVVESGVWLRFGLVCAGVVPVPWAVFSAGVSRRSIPTWGAGALALVPVAGGAVALARPGLFLAASFAAGDGAAGAGPVADVGPWLRLQGAYSVAVLLAGAALAVERAVTVEGWAANRERGLLVVAAVALVGAYLVDGAPPGVPTGTTAPLLASAGVAAAWVLVVRYRTRSLTGRLHEFRPSAARNGHLVVDEDGVVVDATATAGNLLSAHRVEGRPLSDLLPEAERAVAAATETDPATDSAVVGEGADVTYLDVHARTVDAVWFSGAFVTLEDVTEFRSMERRLNTLMEHSTNLIVVLDSNWTIRYVSPSVERLLGYAADVVRDRNLMAFVHPDDRPGLRAELTDLADAGDRTENLEYRVRDESGRWRIHDTVVRDLTDHPDVGGFVLNTRDVTERVERQQELERTNQRLEEFASVVSHDLRNPLTVARGYLDTLGEVDDPEPFVDQIRTSLDRMETIIEDVLELARQGEAVGETTPSDLERLARDAWEQVDAPGASLVVEETSAIESDPDRVKQLFENLFRNSVEHGSTGSRPEADDSVEHGSTGSRPEADDSVEHGSTGSRQEADDSVEHGSTGSRSDGSNDSVEHGGGVEIRVGTTDAGFFVADDGPGIPEEHRDRVLESGYTTREDGTGFGLAIVARIAEAHGWSVAVTESAEGGARFEFETEGVEVPRAVE